MISTHFPGLLALLLLAGICGCAATAPAADEADEYEGRLFSWEFEVAPDQAESAERSSASPTGAEPSTSPAPGTDDTRSTRQTRRIRYSAEDDENGDRGFIIHGADDGGSDDK